ncbi:MAG: tRNA uridine-5-carboxymethylaminomethyl(34) synthesis GTPase MnmE [Chloroflexota bacterium]|nr:tRNA uridine-5-carboxymethylaminomethyl(34) synthesis GTPase MnmE [Chloroflexota bacterium]
MDSSTIAAIATAPGVGAIGVVRISGGDAATIVARVFRRAPGSGSIDLRRVPSHRLLYGRVIDPATGDSIDDVLLGWMAAPHTYTREDTVELSCHGGPVPLRETLRVVLAAGARHAEPGEFTLRAFLNGRLDLTQAEAVLNVVGARTPGALRLAVADLAGHLAERLRPARDVLVSLLAYVDAAADFPDDEIPTEDVDAGLVAAEGALATTVAGARAGMRYREGAQVALVGRPNVGKSSLLNALLRTDRAIVTPIAGTTRDVLAEAVDLRGIPATLLDTAGIAETADEVERLGVERSRRALAASAVAVLVLDGSVPPTEDDLAVARTLAERDPDATTLPPVVVAINKRDLPIRAAQDAVLKMLRGCPAVEVSSLTGAGIEELEEALAAVLAGDAPSLAHPALISARQHAALDRSLSHIRDAQASRRAGYPLDLLAIDIRAALHALGEVTGEAVNEAVLAEIFARFCIGK